MARRRWFVALALGIVAALAATAPANAQEGQASDRQPPADGAGDVLHLRDGRSYRGRIQEIVPADHVTLVGEDGTTKEVPWSDIERIAPGGGPPMVIPTMPAAPIANEPTPTPSESALPTTPSVVREPVQRPRWQPNRPLIVAGTLVFAAGYLPVAAAAVPSTVGFVGRFAILFLTLGLGCLDSHRGYLCRGKHGAIELLIPVVGPVLFAEGHPRDSVLNEAGQPLSGVSKALLYTSAGVQTAGIVVLLSGLAFGGHEPATPPSEKTGTASVSPTFFVGPLDAPGAVGISAGAYRW